MMNVVGQLTRTNTLILVAMFSCSAIASHAMDEQGSQVLVQIAETYDIDIVGSSTSFPVTTTYGKINGERATRTALDAYVPLFVAEFSRYPVGLVKRTRLRRIVLCQKLSFAGQLRNAIPDFEHDVLYLDVSRGAYDTTYLRKVIHHEFFHIIDYRDDGLLYQDESWKLLNPPKFAYGSGGIAAQDMPTTSVLTDKLAGFLNHYSTTGVEEDKAEIFANVLVDPKYVASRAEKDPVLRAKIGRMRKLLRDFYPDTSYWQLTKIEQQSSVNCVPRTRTVLRRRCWRSEVSVSGSHCRSPQRR